MGTYVNPGNSEFRSIISCEYVDKSGLIAEVNRRMNSPESLICVSRPRRFGKSYAAKMLCAYYDCSQDSDALFADLYIASIPSYRQYLNQYNVIYLDMSSVYNGQRYQTSVEFVKENIENDIREIFPSIAIEKDLVATLYKVVESTKKQFFFIIDEWDTPIREGKVDDAANYLKLLRSLFKNGSITQSIFAGVYMTGILPIKKDGSQSALSDFQEYTVLDPDVFSKYIGFTENEVVSLCEKYDSDLSQLRYWYDGYDYDEDEKIYNPNSVMKALQSGKYKSYWTTSSASSNLKTFIEMDFDGLGKAIADIVGGNEIEIDTYGFSNDLVNFHNKDDVLTLLVHLGYLVYDDETKRVRIPNEEIRIEFERTLKTSKKTETVKRIRESEQLIVDTIHENEEAVARQIEKIHSEETTPLFYNNEQALRSVVKLAYFSYRDYYVQVEELAFGLGYVDITYIPKIKDIPALVVELKWNHDVSTAIHQIKEKKYPEVIRKFGGEVLLVGISYDKASKDRKHTVRIEKIEVDKCA